MKKKEKEQEKKEEKEEKKRKKKENKKNGSIISSFFGCYLTYLIRSSYTLRCRGVSFLFYRR
jgi:hypothetical protein